MNPLTTNALASLATVAQPGSARSSGGSWFEAMAQAWGDTLDRQALQIENLSARISAGDDRPATITELSAQSLRMGFLSTSSHTGLSTVGEALRTLAQKS
jgi:hypothetical protein